MHAFACTPIDKWKPLAPGREGTSDFQTHGSLKAWRAKLLQETYAGESAAPLAGSGPPVRGREEVFPCLAADASYRLRPHRMPE